MNVWILKQTYSYYINIQLRIFQENLQLIRTIIAINYNYNYINYQLKR